VPGSPPPIDLPTPQGFGTAAAVGADIETPAINPPNANISIAIPGSPTICGFGIPGFKLNLSLKLPPFPTFGLNFFFALALNCDLINPISTRYGFGGGRAGTKGLDDDPEDD
jgi:hypothetical protein